MGHAVLGIGSAWELNSLHPGDDTDDVYTGTYAQEEWKAIGCDGQLPIEMDGGSGTAGGHWDELCLVNELMTGISSGGQEEYLSRITIGSLKDMGYTVDFSVADAYGKDKLGTCGSYCSTGAPERLRRASEVEKKNEISAEGLLQIRQAAFEDLQRGRLEAPAAAQSENYIYVGGDIVTIYIRDVDGIIKEQTVSWEEVKGMGDPEIGV